MEPAEPQPKSEERGVRSEAVRNTIQPFIRYPRPKRTLLKAINAFFWVCLIGCLIAPVVRNENQMADKLLYGWDETGEVREGFTKDTQKR